MFWYYPLALSGAPHSPSMPSSSSELARSRFLTLQPTDSLAGGRFSVLPASDVSLCNILISEITHFLVNDIDCDARLAAGGTSSFLVYVISSFSSHSLSGNTSLRSCLEHKTCPQLVIQNFLPSSEAFARGALLEISFLPHGQRREVGTRESRPRN